MGHVAFGKLEVRAFFRHRGKNWIKIRPVLNTIVKFNAYTIDGFDEAKLFDEAFLVDSDTGMSEESQQSHLRIFSITAEILKTNRGKTP